MIETINARPAEWTPAIRERWASVTKLDEWEGKITAANWYTARPYRNEYSTGSENEGFCFTVGGAYPQVYDVHWKVGKPAAAYTEPRSTKGD